MMENVINGHKFTNVIMGMNVTVIVDFSSKKKKKKINKLWTFLFPGLNDCPAYILNYF